MIRSLLIITMAFAIVSCGGKKNESVDMIDDLPIQSSSKVIELTVNDEHNAKNSLDYIGKYQGSTKLKNSEIKVIITLSDSTYSLSTEINGETPTTSLKNDGKYTWDESGFIITLEGVQSPSQYRVVEGALIGIDIDESAIIEDTPPTFRLDKIE